MTVAPLDVPVATEAEIEAPPPPPPRRQRFRPADLIGPLVVFAAFVGLWYLGNALMSDNRKFLLPTPHKVIDRSFLKAEFRAELFEALWLSAKVAFIGLAIAIVLGMGIAILMSQARWIERSVYPYLVALQAIPILALVPLIALVFDYSFRSRVLVCVIISIFPITANTLFGLLSVDRSMHELFTLQGASRATRMRKLQLPAAQPAIFTGLRISAGLSVIGAIIGDFFFRRGEPGIGRLIDVYTARPATTPQLYGATILSALLGIAVFWLFGFIGQKAIGRWHETTRGTP
ncbi:MAG TPA: ABC transporter permease [Acidimicrobiales bacterium]|nr:ABC transporter permease [Acidimicrobiales bacterium]